MEPEAGVARDATTLTETVRDLEQAGFRGQVRVLEGARFECLSCHEPFDAAAGDVGRQRRLEGASDPADMLIVIGLTCPHCGTKATAILNYGPEAGVEDAEALTALGG